MAMTQTARGSRRTIGTKRQEAVVEKARNPRRPPRTALLCCAAIVGAIALGSPGIARADESKRIIGFGTGLSAGYWGFAVPGVGTLATPVGFLGDLYVDVPLTSRASIEFWIPVASLVAANAKSTSGIFGFWGDAMLKLYLGGDEEGWFVAPGVGAIYVRSSESSSSGSTSVSVLVPEIPVRAGYEFATDARGFGFTIGVRPWVDLFLPTGTTQFGLAYGVMGELGFNFYLTR